MGRQEIEMKRGSTAICGVISGLPCWVLMLGCTLAASLTDEDVATALSSAKTGYLGESDAALGLGHEVTTTGTSRKEFDTLAIYRAGYGAGYAGAQNASESKLTDSTEPQKPFDHWDLVDEALKDPALARARSFLFDKKIAGSLKMSAAVVMENYVSRASTHKEEQCDKLLKFDAIIDLLPNEFDVTDGGNSSTPLPNNFNMTDGGDNSMSLSNESDKFDVTSLQYNFEGKNVAKMGIEERLDAFVWSCCAYQTYLKQQKCCRNDLKRIQGREEKSKHKDSNMRNGKGKIKAERQTAKIAARAEKSLDDKCCNVKTACCTSPKYAFTTSHVAKMEKTCAVLKQCRMQIPLFKGLHEGCQKAFRTSAQKEETIPRKGKHSKKGKSAERVPASKQVDPVKSAECISNNLRVMPEIGASSSHGPRWQAHLQFLKGSDPCGLLKLSTIRDALSKWAVPKDGKPHTSPSGSFRSLAKGFYETVKGISVKDELSDVSTSVSKKVLVTMHGSTFTKTLVCLRWWTLRHEQKPVRRRKKSTGSTATKAQPKESTESTATEVQPKESTESTATEAQPKESTGSTATEAQAKEKPSRRLLMAKGKNKKSQLSMGCKRTKSSGPKKFNYLSQEPPEYTGLRIPLNHKRCLEDFLPNVVSEKVKEMCARAHFSKPEEKLLCGRTSYSHYDKTLKTKAGVKLAPPLTCENNKFLHPLRPSFLHTCWNGGGITFCEKHVKKSAAKCVEHVKRLEQKSIEGDRHEIEKCKKVLVSNKCMNDIVPDSIRDAALRLCKIESYTLSTKCCTSSNAVFSERLSAKERRSEEA